MSAGETHGFLSLEPEIEKAIMQDRAKGIANPFAFKDGDIVRREAKKHDQATLTRPAFSRDIDKIINLNAYNHYADKTQVFSLVESGDISRRGLHVQLVSRIARSIGELLSLNTSLIEAISLGHDVGHTPFGHAGERYLNACYHAHTGHYFNHNVHSVRVLDTLYRRNISLQTLDGVLCHNGEFAQQILHTGDTHDFETLDLLVDACKTDESTIRTLRPSTLEGCVVRVSDMIAYLGKDRQDALTMGTIDSLDMFDYQMIGNDNVRIINNLTVDLVNNSYGKDHIEISQAAFEDMRLAKKQNFEFIYHKEGMVDGNDNLVEDMFVALYERLLDDLRSGDESSCIFKHHIDKLQKQSRSFTKERYLQEEPNQIVVDYLASMTDGYFLAIYQHLFPQSSINVSMRDYCWDLR